MVLSQDPVLLNIHVLLRLPLTGRFMKHSASNACFQIDLWLAEFFINYFMEPMVQFIQILKPGLMHGLG